jgi:hypothetical protein
MDDDGLDQYPFGPGYKDDTTSRDAAIEMSARASLLRHRILIIALADNAERTPDEIATMLKETPFAIRPRCSELYKLKLIERTGERRENISGMKAHVLRTTVIWRRLLGGRKTSTPVSSKQSSGGLFSLENYRGGSK